MDLENTASPIATNLWQGGYKALQSLPFRPDLHIHCAYEKRPVGNPRRGIWIRLDDCPTKWWNDPQWIKTVTYAAIEARQVLDQGGRVVITCHAGINRSGLITALALMAHRGIGADKAISRIRQRRHPQALNNQSFVAFIETLDQQRSL